MVPLTWTVSVVPSELRSTVTLMPQVPTRVPSRVTVMPPWMVSCSEKALPFGEPFAPMSRPPLATTPVTEEQLLRARCSAPPKLQAVDEEQLASMFPVTVTLPLSAHAWGGGFTATAVPRACAAGPGCIASAAPNEPEIVAITSAESWAVKLPLVGSTQLEPPHETSAAAAAIAILLC